MFLMTISLSQTSNCTKANSDMINPLKTSPEYTRAGVYGKYVL